MKKPKPKKHYAWFVFSTTGNPLLTTAAWTRTDAIEKWGGPPLNGRKVRRCEIVPVVKRRAKG